MNSALNEVQEHLTAPSQEQNKLIDVPEVSRSHHVWEGAASEMGRRVSIGVTAMSRAALQLMWVVWFALFLLKDISRKHNQKGDVYDPEIKQNQT